MPRVKDRYGIYYAMSAKKAEAIRPNSFTDEKQDTDIVITTTELLRMIDNLALICTVRA